MVVCREQWKANEEKGYQDEHGSMIIETGMTQNDMTR